MVVFGAAQKSVIVYSDGGCDRLNDQTQVISQIENGRGDCKYAENVKVLARPTPRPRCRVVSDGMNSQLNIHFQQYLRMRFGDESNGRILCANFALSSMPTGEMKPILTVQIVRGTHSKRKPYRISDPGATVHESKRMSAVRQIRGAFGIAQRGHVCEELVVFAMRQFP